MYRTVVYFFTVVDATGQVEPLLAPRLPIDYAIARGHLDGSHPARRRGEARARPETVETSPMRNLSGELIESRLLARCAA